MLSRISKTIGTHAGLVGVALLALGAGGASLMLAAAPSPAPSEQRADVTQKQADRAARAAARAAEVAATPESSEASGARPTDTHGYCVSQVTQSARTEHSGEGEARVTHGTLVRAAAHTCGKEEAAVSASPETSAADEASQADKAAERAARKAAKQAELESWTHGKPATTPQR